MVDKNLERRIRTAVNHAASDVLDRIITSCQEQKGIDHIMNNHVEKHKKNRSRWYTPLVAAAAILLIVSAGGFGIHSWRLQHTVKSTVMLDVNPSISLNVNARERVVSAVAHNEDGKKILGNMDLENTDLYVAVNALIGSMLQQGYLSDIQNAILVSVENEDYAKGSELQLKITQIIDDILNNNQLQSSVLSQTVSSDQNSKDLAEKFNISEGKASLIQEIVQKDPTLSFDTLASLSVSEIGLLMDSRAIKTDHVKKTGEVSVKGYIGKEAAKAIAFNHAKVSANAVTDAEIEFDIENGTLVYELEFTVGNTEYEYDIHAVTGEIINFSKEYEESGSASLNRDEDDDDDRYERDHDKDDDWDEDDRYEDNRTKDKVTQTSSSANATYIGKTKAKEIAYAHAKVKASQVRESSTELEKENKKMVYEVEFETADGEYEYVIDAVSGKIIYYEYEPEDSRSTMSSSQENDRQNKDGQSIRKHDDDDDWDDDDRYDRDDDRYDRDDDRYERDDDDDDYDD